MNYRDLDLMFRTVSEEVGARFVQSARGWADRPEALLRRPFDLAQGGADRRVERVQAGRSSGDKKLNPGWRIQSDRAQTVR